MQHKNIAIVGLGYVGLPLAIEFGKKFQTTGYDVSKKKIDDYKVHFDKSGQVTRTEFQKAEKLFFTLSPEVISEADFVIVTVPTPIDDAYSPDLTPLIQATYIVGKYLKQGSIVVFESTVFPGATEDVCIPILETQSNLKWKQDFHVGYSPERVNPGDAHHSLTSITKVVSGDDEETLEKVATLYGTIITAGIYKAKSIKVAEAAKVIENTQRDLNIALMNELAIIFNKMNIVTKDVIEAASTKWNFMPFQPGLVGGHCIGVDPYYLTYKAQQLGYQPEVILSGRRINDGMAVFIAQQTIKTMINAGLTIKGSTITVFGLTFKENCPDLRNSKVTDLISEFKQYGCTVFIHDPIADESEATNEYGLQLTNWESLPDADALVVAVAHQDYIDMPFEKLSAKLRPNGVFIDVKSAFYEKGLSRSDFAFWCL